MPRRRERSQARRRSRPETLPKLDNRVAELAGNMDEFRRASETLAERAEAAAAEAARRQLHDIETRIDQLLAQAQIAMRQTAGASGDLTKVRAEVGALTQRIDDIKIEAAAERDVRALQLAIERLSNEVAQSPAEQPLAEFDQQLAELANRLEQSHQQPRSQPATSGTRAAHARPSISASPRLRCAGRMASRPACSNSRCRTSASVWWRPSSGLPASPPSNDRWISSTRTWTRHAALRSRQPKKLQAG